MSAQPIAGAGALSGKACLVTGGGSGIGRATAVAFANAGAAGVVIADIDDDGGARTAALVEEAGARGVFVRTEVSRHDQVTAMVRHALDELGRLDCACNNAGVNGVGGRTGEYDVDDWRRTIDVNLTGVFLCLREELAVMQEQGGGAIVNMSSGAGLVGFPGLPAYVASKHGILGLTKAAALEYVRDGIRVNAVCPGSTRTPLLEAFMGGDARLEQMISRSSPIDRLGSPEEIAAAVVWLCSDAASFVVGHALVADGGAVIQ